MSRAYRRAALAVVALGLLTSRGVTTIDEAIHVDRGLGWLRGEDRLTIDPGGLWVPVRSRSGGLFYDRGDGLRAASPPGMSLIALPLLAASDALSGALGAPPFASSVSPLTDPGAPGRPIAHTLWALRRDLRAGAFSLIGPLSAGLSALFFLLAAESLGLSPRARWLGLAALALGSPLLVYAGSGWTQLPVTAALTYALFQTCERERRRARRATRLGLALALAVLVRTESLLFVVPFGVAACETERRWRRSPSGALARVILPVAVAVCVVSALGGVPTSGGGWSLSQLGVGGAGLLVSPRSGLWVYAPFAILAPLGWRALPEGHPVVWPLVAVPAAALLVYGGWFDWHASVAYGPRLLLPMLPFAALLFARVAERFPRSSVALITLGALVNLPGALLVHARIREHDTFFDLAPLHAYRAWSAMHGFAADCLVLYNPIVAGSLLSVGLMGLMMESTARRR